MTSAIWSTPADKTALLFPIKTLVRFLSNHHLLQIFGQPEWLTIPGGAHTYVEAILRKLPQPQLHTSASVTSIRREEDDKLTVLLASGKEYGPFDQVIFASHADETSKILASSASDTARDQALSALSRFSCTVNHAVLHSDPSLMPKQRNCWTAWNYLIQDSGEAYEKGRLEDTVCLSVSPYDSSCFIEEKQDRRYAYINY